MIHPFVDQQDHDDEICDGESQEHVEAEQALLQASPSDLSMNSLEAHDGHDGGDQPHTSHQNVLDPHQDGIRPAEAEVGELLKMEVA